MPMCVSCLICLPCMINLSNNNCVSLLYTIQNPFSRLIDSSTIHFHICFHYDQNIMEGKMIEKSLIGCSIILFYCSLKLFSQQMRPTFRLSFAERTYKKSSLLCSLLKPLFVMCFVQCCLADILLHAYTLSILTGVFF